VLTGVVAANVLAQDPEKFTHAGTGIEFLYVLNFFPAKSELIVAGVKPSVRTRPQAVSSGVMPYQQLARATPNTLVTW
jgi:hypothetical protein